MELLWKTKPYILCVCVNILFRAKVAKAISRQTHPELLSPAFPIFKMKRRYSGLEMLASKTRHQVWLGS